MIFLFFNLKATSFNNITTTKTSTTNDCSLPVLAASVSKKQMHFENATTIANIDQQDDDLLYKKVYLNSNSNGCAKYRSHLPVFNNSSENDSTKSIKNLVAHPSPSKLTTPTTNTTTTPAIDSSINSLKESINNFKKKFSNTIKLDSNNSNNKNNNTELQNNESLTKLNNSNKEENEEEEEDEEETEEINIDGIQDDLDLAASNHARDDIYVNCISNKEQQQQQQREQEAMSTHERNDESSNDSACKTVQKLVH